MSERTDAVACRRLVDDSIDATVSGGLLQLAGDDLIPEVLGYRNAMLDDSTIHVGDVERSVRRIRQVDRPKSLVGRRQELAAFVRLLRPQPRSIVRHDDPAD